MKYLFALLLPLSLLVVSCGSNEVSEAVNEATETVGDVGNDIAEGASDAMANMASDAAAMASEATGAGMTSINETVDAVRNAGGDITALPAEAAVANIDSWIAKLGSMDGTDKVVGHLNELKENLTNEAGIDGKAVGTLLSTLAEETRALAPDNMALAGLAKALDAGGEKLSGM